MLLISQLFFTFLGGLICIYTIYRSYKNKNLDTVKKISSLFFIKQLPKRDTVKKNIKLPFRFFLELFTLLLITFLLLVIFLNKKNNVFTVIVDNSLSMSSVSDTGKSRLEIGLDLLKSEINSFDLLNIIKTSDQENSTKENTLTTIRPTITDDKLQENLLSILKKHPANKALILTDKKLITKNSKIKVIPSIFNSSRNISLNDSICRVESGELKCTLFFSISGDGNATFKYKVKNNKNNRVYYEFSASGISGNLQEVNFNLSLSLINEIKDLTIELVSPSIRDSITLDNFINIKLAENNNDIELISDLDFNSLQVIKSSLETATKKSVRISQNNSLVKEDTNLKIYYKTKFPTKISSNTFAILPNEESNFLKINGKISNPRITSWDQLSQITRYVNFSNLNIGSSLILSPPNWANLIINTERGAVVLEGIINNYKVVVFGFDLLPYEGSKNTASSILLLNSLASLQNVDRHHGDASNLAYSLEENDTFSQAQLNIPELDELKLPEPTSLISKNIIYYVTILIIFALLLDLVLIALFKKEL